MIEEKYVKRFHARYIISPSGCWEWIAGLDEHGYGVFWSNIKSKRAHRFSWVIFNGEIDANLFVCHRCDNPRCVNPDHLFLGTPMDNTRDMINKGRCSVDVIPDDAARQIYVKYKAGLSILEISKEFNVARTAVFNIGHRISHRDLFKIPEEEVRNSHGDHDYHIFSAGVNFVKEYMENLPRYSGEPYILIGDDGKSITISAGDLISWIKRHKSNEYKALWPNYVEQKTIGKIKTFVKRNTSRIYNGFEEAWLAAEHYVRNKRGKTI